MATLRGDVASARSRAAELAEALRVHVRDEHSGATRLGAGVTDEPLVALSMFFARRGAENVLAAERFVSTWSSTVRIQLDRDRFTVEVEHLLAELALALHDEETRLFDAVDGVNSGGPRFECGAHDTTQRISRDHLRRAGIL